MLEKRQVRGLWNAWSVEEIEKLKTLVSKDGPADWERKAQALGTGRKASAVQGYWNKKITKDEKRQARALWKQAGLYQRGYTRNAVQIVNYG